MKGIRVFTKGTNAKSGKGDHSNKENVGEHLPKVKLLYAFVPSLPFQEQN